MSNASKVYDAQTAVGSVCWGLTRSVNNANCVHLSGVNSKTLPYLTGYAFGKQSRCSPGPGTGNPEALLAQWGLETKRRTSFADLSGGQRQRLFIILALLNNPRVVFFDELTQGLDPVARRDVWDAISDVRARGTTVVLVSHFMDEAEALCDRVAVMVKGRIVDIGTPTDLIQRHGRATTVEFTPPASFDADALTRLPDVEHVEHHGERVRVTGGPALIAPVCAATLDAHGHGPLDLRIHQPSLEDALVNLTASKPT